jgi:uncharacterized protein YuzE
MASIEIAVDGEAAYIHLGNAKIVQTRSKPNGVNLDYDAQGNVVGIELMYLTSVVHIS